MIVLPYSEEVLAQQLANDDTSFEIIQTKNHFLYLKEYFGVKGLNIKTIVVEEQYISKDFIKDFASYYVSCFKDYKKYCKRLHFFSNSFTEKQLSESLLTNNKSSDNFWSHYSGFIVVKPIPVTIIGTTVLRNYPKGEKIGDRNFWGTRDYTINLWGKQLKINSLAFQEQDTVLSACATTCIWTMLQKASEDYTIVLKSPGDITKDAGESVPNKGRLLPNKDGLEVSQMCKAIENCGLEVEIRLPINDKDEIENQYLQKILNAYSPVGIPIILINRVPSGIIDKKQSEEALTNVKYGFHAVAVSGFKKKPLSTLNKETKTTTAYRLIEKIYYHDDQWGPFARAEFSGIYELDTPWTKFHVSGNKPASYVEGIIIPVFSKIRISYDDIETIVRALAIIFDVAFASVLQQGLVWDIRVMYSEDLKKEIKKSELEDDLKLKILTKSLPKFVWVGTCYTKEYRITDFVFDATDIANSMYGIEIIMHYEELKEHLLNVLRTNEDCKHFIKQTIKADYYQFIIDTLSNS